MRLANIPLLGYLPKFNSVVTGLGLNTSAYKIGTRIQLPQAMTIDRATCFERGSLGTSPTYKISIQGIDSGGLPDGTIKGGGSPASATFTHSGNNKQSRIITLDNSYSASALEFVAVVVEYDSGTIDGSNFGSFGYTSSSSAVGFATNAFQGLDFQSIWTEREEGTNLVGDGTDWIGPPICDETSTLWPATLTNTTNPNERGMKFTVPSWIGTIDICGFSWLSQAMNTSGTSTAKLYSGGGASDTTVLASASFSHYTAASNRAYHCFFPKTTLTGGNTYRVALAPDGANGLRNYWRIQNDVLWDNQGGTEWAPESTSRDSGGAGTWTDDPDYREIMTLLVDEESITGSGGGGGSVGILQPHGVF